MASVGEIGFHAVNVASIVLAEDSGTSSSSARLAPCRQLNSSPAWGSGRERQLQRKSHLAPDGRDGRNAQTYSSSSARETSRRVCDGD
ncbi:unnamed protein product [Boreogadus saida]